MKKTCIFLLLAGLSVFSFAGDLVTKSGNVYKNYAIMGAAPTGIRVIYNNGTGDREVILPVSEFPEELSETVNKFARNIPAAKKAAQEQAQQEKAAKAARAQRAKKAKERDKKAAELIQKEQEEAQKTQEKLKKSAKPASLSFKKS
ncbi:MAG: hypothetical protein IJS14_10120 [Lentisphaeria bacterium]|nr:hypothetical protein [Lentisphaeria bacterium]